MHSGSRSARTFPPTRRGLLFVAALLSGNVLAAMAPATASAATAYGFGNFAYGTSNCSGGGSDPVTMFIRTNTSSVTPVNNHIAGDGGYNSSPDGQDQYMVSSYGCTINSVFKNNGIFLSSRYHIRGWGTRPWSSYWVTGATPHYDTLILSKRCHMVWNGDFQKGRDYLVGKFKAAHNHPVSNIWLGNTSTIYKVCGPGYTASDGWAADVRLY